MKSESVRSRNRAGGIWRLIESVRSSGINRVRECEKQWNI